MQPTVRRIWPAFTSLAPSSNRLSAIGDSPVGSRLHRGEPMPEVKDAYESQEDAEKAAAKMQDYHDRFEEQRVKQTKRKRRRQ